jgi:hypothetical protein
MQVVVTLRLAIYRQLASGYPYIASAPSAYKTPLPAFPLFFHVYSSLLSRELLAV